MKIARVVSLTLIIGAMIVVSSCSRTNSSTVTKQTAKVQRGNLVVSSTSTGNLDFTTIEDVAFEVAGTVEQVLVEEGDSVTKDQVLAKLDTSIWDDQIKSLEKAEKTAENNLANTESNIDAQQLAVRQAQINLLSAQSTLSQIPAVKAAQDNVDILQAALTALQGTTMVDPTVPGTQIAIIYQQLTAAKANLQSVISGTSFNLSSSINIQILKAQLSVDQSQKQLDDANRAVTSAISAKDDAVQALADAQSGLEKAKASNPTVVAPFSGIVAKVNVQGGQQVNKGAVAFQIADPTKFKVGVLVSERNISSISIGGTATVGVDSMTGVTLPAMVTAIAPTATIQQGVVNYKVTVEVRSISQPFSGNMTNQTPLSGLGGQFPRNGTSPSITQVPGNQSTTTRPGNPFSGTSGNNANQTVTLRQGLSVTVNLVTAFKNNVIMVPNRAIIRQQGKAYVQLEKNNTTEQVAVTTGIANSQYTEITEGLAEGDTVIIQVTTTSSTSSTQQREGGIFGGGGILR
jgi:multidrug efflux pump subunit AcrA (membrane-fusion protein)